MITANTTRRARLLCGTGIAAACTLAFAPAHAQDAPAQDSSAQAAPAVEAEAEVQDDGLIVVTGSRIARAEFDASTPVSVVSEEEVKLTGTVNIERLLSQSPQFVASQLGGATSNTVPGGYADLNLRGFGATRNLVLVNGRRFAIYDAQQVTDINTIPTSLIKRTEIVTGGSSAVYGSDAITGVVNFIMRDDFEGVEARAQVNLAVPTATPTYNFDLTVGGNFAEGRGNTVVSVNYLKRGAITRGQRGEFAYDSLSDGCVVPGSGSRDRAGTPFPGGSGTGGCVARGGELGFLAGGSGDIPNGRFSGIPVPGSAQSNPALNAAYAAAGLGGLSDRGFTFNTLGTAARPALSPQDDFNLGPDNYLIVPQERVMINSFSHYDFNDSITGYAELHYSNNKVSAQLAPSNVGTPTLFNVNNPYLTPQLQEVLRQLDLRETGTTTVTSGTATRTNAPGDGLALITAGRRYVEVGTRQAEARRNVFRGALGFRGNIGSLSEGFLTDLNYDVYYTYARTEETTLLKNALSRSRLQAAQLSAGGAPPVCNIFGANISAACVTAIAINATNSTVATLQVAAGTLSGNAFSLPAGPVGFSLGAEWRKSEAVFSPDNFLASGDVVGFNPGLPTAGSLSAQELFGEIRVPILSKNSPIGSVTANGAFRHSKYDLEGVGGVWTYLGGLDWRISPDIAFRGQYQRAIRAPNVQELFGGTQRVVGTASDPCGSSTTVANRTAALRAVCVANGVPDALVFTAGIQPNTIIPADFGGNPNVGEEVSDTYTAGVVFTPTFIPRLYVSLDYYNIRLNGAISDLGGGLQGTLNLCFNVLQDNSSQYCQAIHRDPNTGAIIDPFVPQIRKANGGDMKTSGVDFALRYNVPIRFLGGERSSIDFSSNVTWTNEFKTIPAVTGVGVVNECVGAYGATCGQPIPEWRAVNRINLNVDNFTLGLRHRYMSSVITDRYLLPQRSGAANAPALTDFAYPKLDAQNYFDVSFNVDVGTQFSLFGGANNITGKLPPITTQGPSANTFSATYDVLGTEVFLGATVKF